MASALQELIEKNDCSEGANGQSNTDDEHAGSMLMETIRSLVALSNDERMALIALLNALG